MIVWNPISQTPPRLTRLLVWCAGEAFTAYQNDGGLWCTDPEPTLHPIDGAHYPFQQTAQECGLTHWAEIQPPA